MRNRGTRRALPAAAWAVAALLLAAATAAGAGPSATAQSGVTLRVQRVPLPSFGRTTLRFSGTVSSGRAGEYVAVLRRQCGSARTTAIAGASTRAGGAWEAEPAGPPDAVESATYRARWGTRTSRPVVIRGPAPLSVSKVGGTRYRITIDATSVRQRMSGRRVELQQRSDAGWRLVAAATLRGSGFRGTAVVTARARGASYRVHVPERSARPCFAATSSQPFVVRTQPGAAATLDRTLSCATEIRGGLRLVEVRATTGADRGFSVTTNFVPDGTLAAAGPLGLELNPQRCTPSSARPALSAAGLRARSLSGGETTSKCESTPRVLVRLRGVFRAPTSYTRIRPFGYPIDVAEGEVRSATLVVATTSGRRLGFASLSGGAVRLHTAASCAAGGG